MLYIFENISYIFTDALNNLEFHSYLETEKDSFQEVCTTQKKTLLPWETRSFKCVRPVYGSKILVTANDQQVSLCEIQAFSAKGKEITYCTGERGELGRGRTGTPDLIP